MRRRRILLALSLLVCLVMFAPKKAQAAGDLLTTPAALSAFADPIFQADMQRYQVPGAALVIVKDGQIVYAKGYGYADLERQIPWDPDRTVLRAKSISKLVSATAVMQLYERGQLQLDQDVNRYLTGYQVPTPFGRPITAANLLTHTSGLVDRGIASNRADATGLTSLTEYLSLGRYRPVAPPGERISYGDQGPLLLGHLVEQISGQPLADYVDAQIFAPLQMNRSTFRQPYPDEAAANLAMGYINLFGSYQPQPAGYIQVYPASGMLTTATDMGRFMIAHLEGGRYENQQILSPTTLATMHARQFSQHPSLPGITYGFWEEFSHGKRVLWHPGEGLGFASRLYLVPEERLGIFIATNRRDFALHRSFITALMDQLYPAGAVPSAQPLADYQERAARYEGVYLTWRHDPRMLDGAFSQMEVTVTANDDGTLSTAGEVTGRWIEVDPLLFRRVDGPDYLAFEANSAGEITGIFPGKYPWALQKGRWYDALGFRIPLLAVSLLILWSFLLVWPLRARRMRRGVGGGLRVGAGAVVLAAGRWEKAAFLTAALAGLLLIVFLAAWAPIFLVDAQGGTIALHYGVPGLYAASMAIPMIIAVLAAGLTAFGTAAWIRRVWSPAFRVYYTLVALSALGVTWTLSYLNMIGFCW
ncbi:MAG TPA: serine hydrolase domain-containing protein [Symbiobacteriaceae bacterium]|nr:serine hydrolase domain-containing protein [Symbiobacteriaceae bacterium]